MATIAAVRAPAEPFDIFSPCALGAVRTAVTIPQLRCYAVVGSANNQFAEAQDAQRIAGSGVLYAPDYVVNAGGVINIAEEQHGYDRGRAEQRIARIHDTVHAVLDLADAEHCTTADRSEEHTSELQSLMRISYAVFCLKKKKNKTSQQHKTSHRQKHSK